MLQVEYSLEKKEFQEFIYYANWLSPEQKDHRFNYYFANAISYIVMVSVLALSFRKDVEPVIFLSASALTGVFLFLYLKGRTKSFPYKVAEDMILKEGGQDVILSRRELIVSDAGIIVKHELFESKFMWLAVKRKIEHLDCFYLYTGPRDAIIIPKRIFINKEDSVKFKEYLLEHLPIQADFPKAI